MKCAYDVSTINCATGSEKLQKFIEQSYIENIDGNEDKYIHFKKINK